MRVRSVALAALLLAVASPAGAQDACEGVGCSGHGTCFAERGQAACLCDEGFVALGTSCAEAPEGAPSALPARHQRGVGERVVSIAEAQIGRRRGQVCDGDDALGDYLAAGEWWCGDFVAWAYARAGVPFDGGAMGGWLVTNNHAIRAWFEARDLWVERTGPAMAGYEPSPGDFVRFPTERGGHAAIVSRVVGTTLYTVEGNVSGAVEEARYFHYRDNPLIEGFGRLELEDAPPRVEASAPREAVVGRWIALEGTAEDDGPRDALRLRWSAEPAGARFFDPERPDARVSFERSGRFVLTLAADDGAHREAARLTVVARRDDPPRVVLRAEETAPLFARLSAEVHDEAEPALRWEVVAGPEGAEVADPEAAATEITFEEAGRYVISLGADDGTHRTERQITVDVPGGPFGCAASPGRGGDLAWVIALAMGAWIARRRGGAAARRASHQARTVA